jgi:hypothetical protein
LADADCREPRKPDASKRLLTSAAAASVDADLERAILRTRASMHGRFREGLASFSRNATVWSTDVE